MKVCIIKSIAILSTMVAAMLFSTESVAQTHYESNVTVGLKAGCDISRMFFTPSVKQVMNIGGTAGVAVRYIEENHFGIIGELNFAQRGWGEDFEGAPYHYKRTLNYLHLPVLAHIYFGRRARFFINLGPEIGVLLSESTKSNFRPDEMASLPDFPNSNRMNTQMTIAAQNRFDYGIAGGLGCEFNINKRHSLFLEGRYYFGLGNLFKSRRTDPFSSSNSMTISVTAGYWFRVK